MFFFKKLFFVILFIFIGISNSYSDQKIAFIDLDFVVEQEKLHWHEAED